MKIAIVSDSHGDLYTLDKVIEPLKDIEAIIHLGDHFEDILTLNKKYNKKLIYVAGNNDWDEGKEELKEKTIDINGFRIFLTHGHRYGVYYGIDKLYYRAKEKNADIVLFGHTHRQMLHSEDNITFFNPGSISYPRDMKKGYGILEINNRDFKLNPLNIL